MTYQADTVDFHTLKTEIVDVSDEISGDFYGIFEGHGGFGGVGAEIAVCDG